MLYNLNKNQTVQAILKLNQLKVALSEDPRKAELLINLWLEMLTADVVDANKEQYRKENMRNAQNVHIKR